MLSEDEVDGTETGNTWFTSTGTRLDSVTCEGVDLYDAVVTVFMPLFIFFSCCFLLFLVFGADRTVDCFVRTIFVKVAWFSQNINRRHCGKPAVPRDQLWLIRASEFENLRSYLLIRRLSWISLG